MNEIDPSLFFSTTAQSFTVVVALFGIFILAKFASLSTKKNNLESLLNDFKMDIKNLESQYKLKISEWRKPIEASFFSRKMEQMREIDETFEHQLRIKLENINQLLPYESIENQFKEILRNIYKISLVSLEIFTNMRNSILDGNLGSVEEIREKLIENKVDSIKIFNQYDLKFEHSTEVAAYIYNEVKRKRTHKQQVEAIKSAKKALKPDELKREYRSIKFDFYQDDVNSDEETNIANLWEKFNEKEAGLSKLWEEFRNQKIEKNRHEGEIKQIINETSIKEGFKLLKFLFLFGVAIPLLVLLIDSTFGRLDNITYKMFFLFTLIGIIFVLREITLYFKNYLKF